MAKKKPILYPVVFMVAVTAVFTFLLAYINASTIDEIQRQEELRLQRSILYVFNIPFDANDDNAVIGLYDTNIRTEEKSSQTVFIYEKDSVIQGYAFQFTGKALWGTVTGHMAFEPSFHEILGLNFIAHSETPGLGGRIDESWYKDQFRGIELVNPQEPIIYRPKADGNVDAISGATGTSEAIRATLNEWIPEILTYAKEVGYRG